MIRICRRCKGRVMPEKGKLREKYPYYCPTCYENMFSFETDKTALQEKDICMGMDMKEWRNLADINV